MSLSNSIIHIDGSSDSSLNESLLKDKRRRSTFYVQLANENNVECGVEEKRLSGCYDNHLTVYEPVKPRYKSYDASSLSSQTSSDTHNGNASIHRQQKFRCAAGCSGNTTVVMILPDGDDFGDTDDENGDMEVKTVNGKQVVNREKLVQSYYDNNLRELPDLQKSKSSKCVQDQKPKVAPRTLLTKKYEQDNLILRKTPSMSSVESTPKRKTLPGVLKSQSRDAVVTVRNPTPIKMRLSVSKESSPNLLSDKQKCRTLPIQQQQQLAPLQQTPKSPSKLGLGFVRRAHSAKLTRSNSFLKALATKCAGPSICKDIDSSVIKSEVIPLNGDMLKEALNNGAGKVLARAFLDNGVNGQVTTSASDDEEDDDPNSDTSYEKACRRGSAPATPVLGSRPSSAQTNQLDGNQPTKQDQQQQHTPSRLASFFSKRSFRSNPLKRTKSVTKLERCRRGGQPCGLSSSGMSSSMVTRGGLRGSRSHESLLGGHAALSTIELGCGEVVVAPVHASVAGRQWCFEVRGGSRPPRYFCCSSREERDLWMHSLRQSIQPSADQLPRTDNSLKLWLLEAKCLPPKRKYYCDVLLDGTLHARTAAKARGEILFWGELFDLTDLPNDVKELKVEVYREGDRKRKRDKQVLVGSVRIPINELEARYFIERWYPILSDKDFNSSGSLSRNTSTSSTQRDGPTLRLKARYQSTRVRPLADYENFTEYLKRNYKLVCESLEPVIGVKAKEDIASSMVLLMQSLGQAGPFLADVVCLDLLRVGDQRLTFRGNSLATKAMEAFLKLTGEQYLQETLGPPVRAILASSSTCDCEVDPARGGVSPNSTQLLKNQNALREAVSSIWTSVKQSHEIFPLQIRECFATFRRRLAQLNRQDMADNLISASIFLRFLCPAILSPSLFNITNEYPDERAARNLTLVTKTIQTLANFTKFQGKEGFMEFLNDFLLQEAPDMKEFLYRISAPLPQQEYNTNTNSSSGSSTTQWSGHIDRGKQLSLLQSLLLESLPKVPPNKQQELQELKRILDALVNKPEQQIRDSRNSMLITDNIFRFNDPTVQNTMPLSNVTLNEAKLQKSPTTIITSTNGCVQNNIVTSSSEINQEEASNNQQPKPSPTKFNYPKKSPNLGVRAATLPRNTYNQICTVEICNDNNDGNLIPIGLETSSAFVRKSPTPKLKNNVQNVNDRINCNIKNTANLDELSDLFAYADEQNVDLVNNTNVVQNHVQNKGSNISIGQLSNVCSSGYQSITTQSQSSSPTDLINPIKIKMKPEAKQQETGHNNNNMALAFENPVYHMDFQNKNNKKLSENSLTPSSSEENLQRATNYISSPLDTPSPVMRRNLRIPRTNPGLSYRNNRISDEKRIDEHRYEIDRNVKDLASVENEQNYLANKFKRSLDKIDYKQYNNDYDYNNRSPVHQTIGIPLQHSHSNNSLYYPNSNCLNHSYSNTSLQNSSNNKQRLQYLDNQNTNVYANKRHNGGPSYNDCSQRYINNKHLNFDDQNYECFHGYNKNKNAYDDQFNNEQQNGCYVIKHNVNYDSENMNPDSAYQSADVVHCSGSLQKKLARRMVDTDSSSESEIQSRSESCSQRSTRTVEMCEMEIAKLQRTIDRLQAKLQRSGKNGHQQYTVSDDNKMKSIIARMLSVEEERKREQMKMSLALSHKQRVIDAQGQQIAALDAANSRLLSALSSLRHNTGGPTAVNLNNTAANDLDDEA